MSQAVPSYKQIQLHGIKNKVIVDINVLLKFTLHALFHTTDMLSLPSVKLHKLSPNNAVLLGNYQ